MNTATYQCSCGWSTNNPVAWEHHTRNCKSRVNWNSRFIVAIIAAIIFATSLLMPAKAQQVQPTPAPTATVGDPPANLSHVVYMPIAKADDIVFGQPGGLPAH